MWHTHIQLLTISSCYSLYHTDQAGWGIAWYINGTLIPELIVERNKTYTFLVQGGDNADRLDVYHPFYITSSIVGGRLQNSADMQIVIIRINAYIPVSSFV